MISVCLTTYNGERYLGEQLDSILIQLEPQDELLISDDGSTDQTLKIIEEYQANYTNIKFFNGPHQGIVANYDFVISKAVGEFVFLSDQDDVWLPNKVEVMRDFFQKHPDMDVVISDLVIVDGTLETVHNSYFGYRKIKNGWWHNIMKNGYIGAGMCFRRKIIKKILPIPTNIPMHDMWIGLIGATFKRTAFLPETLTLYRRHGKNSSEIKTKTSFQQKLYWRIILLNELFKRIILGK